MSWITLRIETPAHLADPLSDALFELGALASSIEDGAAGTEEEAPIFAEPGEPSEKLWSKNWVTGLFEVDTDLGEILLQLEQFFDVSQLPVHIDSVAEQDWVRLTQSQFEPIPISPRLWITPTWHANAAPVSATQIVLDPGLAFGTGSHPTTHLCLAWLDAELSAGASVLDYGCGSGILAIAAKKLGAGRVLGVDIDQQAVLASQQNALQNQVEIDFYLPNHAPSVCVDIVVANILTNPLKVLAPLLASQVRAAGQIVLSGILATQAEDVMRIYAEWFTMQIHATREGWVCLHGIKQA